MWIQMSLKVGETQVRDFQWGLTVLFTLQKMSLNRVITGADEVCLLQGRKTQINIWKQRGDQMRHRFSVPTLTKL